MKMILLMLLKTTIIYICGFQEPPILMRYYALVVTEEGVALL
jgi:hypothetical protein